MRKLIIVVFAIISALTLFAQQPDNIPFNGLVTDALGNGVKAKIQIKNTSLMTTSTKDGKFGFTSVNGDDTLVVKYKKLNIEIAVDNRKSIKIKLIDNYQAQAEFEPELVNLGYGYVSRRESAASSHGISGDLFKRGIFRNLGDAIKSTYPGVIINSDGTVVLRGSASINGNTNAIIVVDGVVTPSLNDVNVYDIESVEVSTDGSIYGSRGGSGVVQITTTKYH